MLTFLEFTPPEYFGDVEFTLTLNDQGNYGEGEAETVDDTITITVDAREPPS